jgi:uncharacterized protein (TIGR02099 family)
LLFVVGAGASLLLAGWLTLNWGFLPHLDRWRPEIEQQLSRSLGSPVRIGQLEAASHGLHVTLVARDVQWLGPDGAAALTLPRVEARWSPASLLGRGLRLDHLQLDAAALELRRDALGRLHVAGLPVRLDEGDEPRRSPAADWIFNQRQIVVSLAALRWIDETRVGAPPLELTDVRVVARNGLRQHDLRLEATPPDGWGARFTLQGRFTQDLLASAGDISRWDGTLHADLPHADLARLREHVTLPFELREGRGGVRAWIEVSDGLPTAVTADLALEAVALRLASTVEPLEVSRIQGRLIARRSDDGVSLQAQGFGFTTGDGVEWPRSDARVAWRQAQSGPRGGPGQPVTGGEFSADRLDLAVMSQIAARLPLGDAIHLLLETLRPAGRVEQLAGRWDGPPDAPWRYQVQGQAAGLALSAGTPPPDAPAGALGRPGGTGAAVEFKATERGGEATVAIQRGELEFPGLFDEPVVPLRELKARLAWTVLPVEMADAPPRIELQVRGARFANADTRGSLDLRWRTGAGTGHGSGGRWPGVIDLEARLDSGRVDRVARYLPRGLPSDVRTYLGRALQAGEIGRASIVVRGDVWDFPYLPGTAGAATPGGEFRVAATVRDTDFAYVPDVPVGADEPAWRSPWPAMSGLQAEVAVDRSALTVRNARARIGRLELVDVEAAIPDLVHGATLAVSGTARGPAQDLLGFVAATPVRDWTHRALDELRASGNAEVPLALRLPLTDLDRTTVQGAVRLDGNELRFGNALPALAGARGRVDFTERGLSVAGARVRVAGGEASIDGGLLPDGRLRFSASGTATAEGLRQTPELGLPAPLLRSMAGQAPYRLQMTFQGPALDWSLTSPLTGLAVNLPAPLGKGAEATLPLRIEVANVPVDPRGGGTADGATRDQLRVDIGDGVQARYWREFRGDTTRILRGALAVNDRLPEPGDGVVARVRLAALDLDAWRAAGFGADLPGAADGPAGSASAASYMPTDITLRVAELRSFERRLTQVDARAFARAGQWRTEIVSDQVAGQLEWGRDGAGDRLRARLARLTLPPNEVAAVERLLASPPAALPALDIVVDDFVLRDRRLGRLEIEAINRPVADDLRDWQLTRLVLSNPDARLTATGHWNAMRSVPGAPRQRVTALDVRLDITDSGQLLTRLGSGRAIRGGPGQLTGRVQWVGSPLDPAFKTMTGDLALALEGGQFLRADPGAARLLSVLSLQALPRRLALDFRDVFQEGFAFDAITGNVVIDQGIARTNNLRMRGVQAVVLMDGSADLRSETQQLRVVVVPEINAGTASLAYATINPAIGLGTFLAQVFLRKPLAEAGTREFRVSGSWEDPKVERVERGEASATPPPEAAAAAGAPARPPTQ